MILKHFFVFFVFAFSWQANASQVLPKINSHRLIEQHHELAKYGKNSQNRGTSRLAYSDADLEGRKYVLGLMKEAGLSIRIDEAGNLVGTYAGKETLKPIVMGSHIDTVPEGGNFDGISGSLSSIEVIRTLKENKFYTKHPLEVIIFQNEEGGHIGSRAITSGLTQHDLDFRTLSGKKVRDGIKFIGGNPDQLSRVKKENGSISSFIELHVEQGGILEKEKTQIGIVEGIVGIRRWDVTYNGFANHAGTTPMSMRRDALLAASRLIDSTNRIVTSIPGNQVATAGKIEVIPGAPNVIPGTAHFTIEVRDLSSEKIDQISEKIFVEAKKIARDTKTTVKFEKTYDTAPSLTDPIFHKLIEEAAKELNLSTMKLPSGAGHDAQEMADIGPMGMIFIPSINGISHSPEENTKPKDIENGANVLLRTLIKFDQLK